MRKSLLLIMVLVTTACQNSINTNRLDETSTVTSFYIEITQLDRKGLFSITFENNTVDEIFIPNSDICLSKYRLPTSDSFVVKEISTNRVLPYAGEQAYKTEGFPDHYTKVPRFAALTIKCNILNNFELYKGKEYELSFVNSRAIINEKRIEINSEKITFSLDVNSQLAEIRMN